MVLTTRVRYDCDGEEEMPLWHHAGKAHGVTPRHLIYELVFSVRDRAAVETSGPEPERVQPKKILSKLNCSIRFLPEKKKQKCEQKETAQGGKGTERQNNAKE